MSGYGEGYRAEKQARFVEEWAPGELPELSEENLRWNIARPRAAEHELAELKRTLRTLRDAIR